MPCFWSLARPQVVVCQHCLLPAVRLIMNTSFQLCIQWHHTGSLKSAVMGIFIPQKSASTSIFPFWKAVYQHTIFSFWRNFFREGLRDTGSPRSAASVPWWETRSWIRHRSIAWKKAWFGHHETWREETPTWRLSVCSFEDCDVAPRGRAGSGSWAAQVTLAATHPCSSQEAVDREVAGENEFQELPVILVRLFKRAWGLIVGDYYTEIFIMHIHMT